MAQSHIGSNAGVGESRTAFHTFPHPPSIPITPFKAAIPQQALDDLKRRIEDAPAPRQTFENSTSDEQLGVKRKWIVNAVEEWKKFDWRATEAEINSFPNFKARIEHLGHDFDVHFIALFSTKEDAVPVVMSHGWPGSIIEFLPLLHHLQSKYTPSTLPIHLIVPSLIGFGFSSPPPIDRDFATPDNAYLFDKLMRGLGFDKFVAQGGDIGSYVSRCLGARSSACRAVHLDFVHGKPPGDYDINSYDEFDRKCIERLVFFDKFEFSYRDEHATKTSTIAMVCESSPLALLAWIGEKFLVWTDEDPPVSQILADVSFYWLTNSFATSLYHYRTSYGKEKKPENEAPQVRGKPVGYSQFAKEIAPAPREWAQTRADIVWHRRHEKGGHFAAMEQPETFWEDVSSFIEAVWE